ncbi:MAG: DMT family transporter [Sphingomonadales bacterium]
MVSHLPERQQAMIYMIWSGLLFGMLWAVIRYTSETVHPFLIVFYRTLFALLAFTPILMRSGLGFFKTKRIRLHAVRALFALGGTLGTFYAIANAPLSDVVAISYASPVFAAAGAVFMLGERIKFRRILSIALGFAGVLLVTRPGFETLSNGIVAAIIGALAIGGSLVVIKSLASTDDPRIIAAYSFLLILPATFLIALTVWKWPTPEEWALLVVIGFVVSVAHTALARAFSMGDAVVILPLDFVRLLVATLLGVLLFDEPLDLLTWSGALLILGSTVYTAHREAMQGKSKPKI